MANEIWLAIGTMNMGQKEGQIFLSSPLDPIDLPSTSHQVIKWDSIKGELVSQTEQRIGNILISATKSKAIDDQKRIETICKAIKEVGNKLLPFSDEVNAWQARVMSLRQWNKKENWPDVSTEILIQTVNIWLTPYLSQIRKSKDLQKLNLLTILQNSLPFDLSQKLDLLAPNKIEVPSGSFIKLKYFENSNTPILAVRLQEVFGLLETPKINNTKNTVLLHLLSPGYKPVQVTADLHSFWENTYKEVKKELKSRYPKHSWPEDPWTATAIRGAQRRKHKNK